MQNYVVAMRSLALLRKEEGDHRQVVGGPIRVSLCETYRVRSTYRIVRYIAP